MTDHFVTDMLICGAGAAGLTLAIDLARQGVSFRFWLESTVKFSSFSWHADIMQVFLNHIART